MKMKRSLMLIIAVFAVTPIFSFYAFAEESAMLDAIKNAYNKAAQKPPIPILDTTIKVAP